MKTNVFKQVFGMVHVGALPGTPRYQGNMSAIISKAVYEAELLLNSGFDGIILENMHDLPYLNRQVGTEIIAGMTVICGAVRSITDCEIGIQVLAGANKAALAIASVCELGFIRAEGYVFSQISDEGMMNGDAGELQRYRRQIDAEEVKIYCDIKKKHSAHAITADIDIAEMAKAAEFFLADGVIVTGISTGSPADKAELKSVGKAVNCPVLIGSGLTSNNLAGYWDLANGFIIGSYLKIDGLWSNDLDAERLRSLMDLVTKLRNRGIDYDQED
ncbi:MAG: BtpA/SgcQ family protein [Candidatus Stygibacter frigidus]|nr:BtpA/SgcQ family protein [Candidatus Stygibacter frigidus]